MTTFVTPPPSRSLTNEIARALLDGLDKLTWNDLRIALEQASIAHVALSNYLLVFGPEQLVEALCRD